MKFREFEMKHFSLAGRLGIVSSLGALALVTLATLLSSSAALALTPRVANAHDAPYRHVHPPPHNRRHPARPHRPPQWQSTWESRLPTLYVGIGPEVNHLLDNRDFKDVSRLGYGPGFSIGARLNPLLALEANWMGTFHESSLPGSSYGSFSSTSLAARLYLPLRSQVFAPYLQGGLGSLNFRDRAQRESLKGVAGQAGLGMDISIGHNFGLGTRVLYRTGSMDNLHDRLAEEDVYADVNSVSATAFINIQF